MSMSAKLTAEERFAATQKKVEPAVTASELQQQEKADRTDRLRTLRLAKEAEETDAKEKRASDKGVPEGRTVGQNGKK